MKFLAITISLFCCFITGCKRDNSYEQPLLVPKQVTKGVNLIGWFNDGANPAVYETRFTQEVLAQIKAEGFTYIRIPVGRTVLFQEAYPAELNSTNAAYLDSAIKMAIDAGLAVMLDGIHADNFFERRIVTEAGFENKIINYWEAVVKRYKKYSSNDLFFELYNEPFVRNDSTVWVPDNWWAKTQEKIVAAIRKITTDHYLVLTGNRSFIKGLKAAPPVKGKNIIYNFHFYDPYLFTHQGSITSGWDHIEFAANVPYPSSPELVAPLINVTNDPQLKGFLTTYGNQRINKDSVDKWLSEAFDWSRANNVQLICNEFGTVKHAPPNDSRIRYFYDVRTILEKYKIGWGIWEFDLQFGIKNNNSGSTGLLHPELKEALGL
ncbi:hypothetical protein ESA94_21090 [Lacibacter luteus]|uniref:Glycoside hydrolase family 5 domain-containing protein n=1 Tax=Lacibacter luteus TaxID=2508719 RepID=A0A4Q1CDL5_9BACT|nr:cellulase family glycosylhydrolase [Lacibacter luteus]RXK57430.1 hypothetical protein ESA94_21090 [Lacibacter luteus]